MIILISKYDESISGMLYYSPANVMLSCFNVDDEKSFISGFKCTKHIRKILSQKRKAEMTEMLNSTVWLAKGHQLTEYVELFLHYLHGLYLDLSNPLAFFKNFCQICL